MARINNGDDLWEDVDSTDTSVTSGDGVRSSEPASPRKRNKSRVAPRSSSPLTKPSRDRKPVPRERTRHPPKREILWRDAAFSVFVFVVTYISDILRLALIWLRKPLSLILVGYLLAVLVSQLQQMFSTTLNSTMASLCVLPGVSRTSICRQISGDSSLASFQKVARHADYPTLVDIQSATFERLLDDSVGGAALALEIKKAEMATSDLTTMVRVSGLTSKERMAEILDKFVEDARRTSRGLQRFSAKVGGSVDGIMAVNDYALKRIELAAANTSPSLLSSVLVPFSRHSTSMAVVTSSFTQAMAVLESEIHMLIMAAEASLHDLDALEEQLKLLNTMVFREDDSLSTSRQELLSKLWTMVGGNRAELRRHDSHLKLLGELAGYRKRALAHVVGALQTLQTMSAQLEDLRERVSQPVMLSEAISLEAHVKSIKGGLDRLAQERLKAKNIEDARYARLVAPLEQQ